MQNSDAPATGSRDQFSHWIAGITIALLGAIVLIFADVTLHGADQIRDLEVARNFVRHHVWPVDSPPMFGEHVQLPPAFYYLLSLPLLVWDRDEAVFIVFGLFFILSVACLWREVARHFGARCGLIYAVFAFPVFATIHAHSAWNPALVMTLSNLWLALFIRAIELRQTAWVALPLVAYVLLQVHPSAAPLLLGLAAYVLIHPRVLANKATLLTAGALIALTAAWVFHSDAAQRLLSLGTGGNAAASPVPGTWHARLLDVGKWRDALAMPYTIVKGIEPAIPALPLLTGLHLAAMLGSVLLGLGAAIRSRAFRWILLSTVAWFAAALALLGQGSFWHLYVIQPWLAVLAALGLGQASEKVRLSGRAFNLVAAALALMIVAAHLLLYLSFVHKGDYDLRLSHAFFPRARGLAQNRVPAYSYRYLADMRNSLASHGICSAQVAGVQGMVMQDMNLRSFEVPCDDREAAPHLGYFLAHGGDPAHFDFTKGLQPLQTVGDSALYAVEPILLGGQAVLRLRTDDKLNYMTYAPARLDDGLRITLSSYPQPAILRVALRCLREYPAQQAGNWRVQGVGGAPLSLKSRHQKYLGFDYYDLEWRLPPSASSTVVSSMLGALECDVSAIARAER